VLQQTSASDLHKLHGLTIITSREKRGQPLEEWKNILSNLSQCQVIVDESKSEREGDYFNSLRDNPAPMEI
jgi:hypothetical protein